MKQLIPWPLYLVFMGDGFIEVLIASVLLGSAFTLHVLGLKQKRDKQEASKIYVS
ncbi:hypothetical protein [Deinococcus sonorensis]|uniref:Uncharacterized protein n=1 Tax=Deinococcus sonorensis KR-87 TaxID=694439 RepID=A0AAU7UHA4_9DEIO